jgi:hypothetical protein
VSWRGCSSARGARTTGRSPPRTGADPDWPAWYGAYLVEPLAMLLGVRLTPERLASELAEVDAEHPRRAPSVAWSTYYAGWLMSRHLPA